MEEQTQTIETQVAIKKSATTALGKIQEYVSNPDVKERLKQMLGDRAGAFANSIINVFKNNMSLQKCEPATIMSAAMIAASMNLPIDPALGYAAIVPYGTTAQFQIMYKGLIQLCIRSGQYAHIHNTEVYADELKKYDPITGKIEFNDQSTYKMRTAKNPADVIGFYSCFKLTSGFECENFITTAEAMAHGKRFSKAYQYDLNQGKRASLWSLDPVAMGKKTSLKMLLGKYGIMSIEMQEAFVAESDDFNDSWQEETKLGADAVRKKIGRPAGSKNKTKIVESTEIKPPEEKDPNTEAKKKEQIEKLKQATPQSKYKCNNPDCGFVFDAPVVSGIGEKVCPECGNIDFYLLKPEPKKAEFHFKCKNPRCLKDFPEPTKEGLCPYCLTKNFETIMDE